MRLSVAAMLDCLAAGVAWVRSLTDPCRANCALDCSWSSDQLAYAPLDQCQDRLQPMCGGQVGAQTIGAAQPIEGAGLGEVDWPRLPTPAYPVRGAVTPYTPRACPRLHLLTEHLGVGLQSQWGVPPPRRTPAFPRFISPRWVLPSRIPITLGNPQLT